MSGYDDFELATFTGNLTIGASDLDGSASKFFGQNGGFEALKLLDYDDFVDRSERLDLIRAEHSALAYVKSTGTADGTVRAILEVSASATRSGATQGIAQGANVDGLGDWSGALSAEQDDEDSIDLVGRPLHMVGFEPFSDSGGGVGGGGSVSRDTTTASGLPSPLNEFHPRDELFANGYIEVQNVADAAVHVEVMGQHIYGVVEE